MIADAEALKTLQEEWGGVARMRRRLKILLAAAFAAGASTAPALADAVYNLPVLLAYDVLAQALRVFKAQGEFSCKSNFLGPMLEASKESLPWLDWQTVRAGVDLRNAVAHDGTLHDRATCWKAIAAVENQLTAWRIVAATQQSAPPPSSEKIGVE